MRRQYLPAFLIAVCGAAFAQMPSRPSPGEMLQVTDATLERTIETQIAAQLKVAERPETAERVASFKKNLFDALRKKGFTAEQSLQIVIATPMPALAAAK